jgi:hypothetical protein
MLIDQPQAFALAGREQSDGIFGNVRRQAHGQAVNDALGLPSTSTRVRADLACIAAPATGSRISQTPAV